MDALTKARSLIRDYFAAAPAYLPHVISPSRRDACEAALLDVLCYRLWDCKLTVDQLMELAEFYGADIPSEHHRTVDGLVTRLRSQLAKKRAELLKRRRQAEQNHAVPQR